MITTRVILLAFPSKYCLVDNLNLSTLMERALRIEKKIETGVNVEDELRRYRLYCNRLEYYASHISELDDVFRCDLGEGYLDMLISISQRHPEHYSKYRLGANFCPSDFLAQAIEGLVSIQNLMDWQQNSVWQKKIDFYRHALANNLHILETQALTSNGSSRIFETTASLTDLNVRDDITHSEDNAFKALRKQFNLVVRHLSQNIPDSLNFSDLGHHVITEIIHEMVYKRGPTILVPVVYADGSVAPPFPIQCLKQRTEKEISSISHIPTLPIGMMAQRHTELDPKISMYWFRNQELSVGKRAAEVDELAYRQSKTVFAQMYKERIYRIAFFQTGFQPVVVGFYRALAEALRDHQSESPKLEIIPYYFLHHEYREGEHWI